MLPIGTRYFTTLYYDYAREYAKVDQRLQAVSISLSTQAQHGFDNILDSKEKRRKYSILYFIKIFIHLESFI